MGRVVFFMLFPLLVITTRVLASCVVGKYITGHTLNGSFSFELLYGLKELLSPKITLHHDRNFMSITFTGKTANIYSEIGGEISRYNIGFTSVNWGWKQLTVRCKSDHIAVVDDELDLEWMPFEMKKKKLFPCQPHTEMILDVDSQGVTTNCREAKDPIWIVHPKRKSFKVPLDFSDSTGNFSFKFQVIPKVGFHLKLFTREGSDKNTKSENIFISGSGSMLIEFHYEQSELKMIWPGSIRIISTAGKKFILNIENTGSSVFNITQLSPSNPKRYRDVLPVDTVSTDYNQLVWPLVGGMLVVFGLGIVAALYCIQRKRKKTSGRHGDATTAPNQRPILPLSPHLDATPSNSANQPQIPPFPNIPASPDYQNLSDLGLNRGPNETLYVNMTRDQDKHVYGELPDDPGKHIYEELPEDQGKNIYEELPDDLRTHVNQVFTNDSGAYKSQVLPDNKDEHIYEEVPGAPQEHIYEEVPGAPQENIYEEVPGAPQENIYEEVPGAPQENIYENIPDGQV